MRQQELVINKWTTSFVTNSYDSSDKKLGTVDRHQHISTYEFFNKLNNGIIKELLPVNCRYKITLDNGYKIFVIEDPPQMRTIFLNHDMSMTIERLKASGDLKKFGYEEWNRTCKQPYKLHLAFPYLIYVILMSQDNQLVRFYIFSRVTPLGSFADYLCKVPLPNINEDQHICLGSTNINEDQHICLGSTNQKPNNILLNINNVLDALWKNIFNNDYIYNLEAYQNIPFVWDFLTWQYYSKIDPMFIYNVEWIPTTTLGTIITRIKRSCNISEENDSNFPELIDKIFHQRTLTDKVDRITHDQIIDNVTDSINIDRIPIFLNDSFILKNKRIFVKSFLSTMNSPSITHIQLQDNNKATIYRLTSLFKKYLRTLIMKERFIQTTELKDGSVIKAGSIISSTNTMGKNIFDKIIYMRYGLDGKIEARTKSKLMVLEDIPHIKNIDVDNMKVNGIPLKKNQKYNISYVHTTNIPVKIIRSLIVDEIDVSSSNQLTVYFKNNCGNPYNIPLDQMAERVINNGGFKSLPRICRLGTILVENKSMYSNSNHSNSLFIKKGEVHFANYRQALDVIFQDKEHLFIESFDMNLSFKVGDKVVISDWANPIEMLTVKTITGFSTINYKVTIFLKDQHGNTSKHVYVCCPSNNIVVNIGTMRHIESTYDEISTGFKIKAKVNGISNFPKKNVNIIIGFLTDTGGDIPLVLCSNGATLWWDDLKENFNLISMSNKKWKSLTHAPMIGQHKFKYQSGDLTTIPNHTNKYEQNLLSIRDNSKLISHYLVQNNAINMEYIQLMHTNHKTISDRIGFLTPRHSKKQLDAQPHVPAYPNFHGMYNYNPNTNLKFKIDQRRILNVSDIPV